MSVGPTIPQSHSKKGVKGQGSLQFSKTISAFGIPLETERAPVRAKNEDDKQLAWEDWEGGREGAQLLPTDMGGVESA